MSGNLGKLLLLVVFIALCALVLWMVGRKTFEPGAERPVSAGTRTIIEAANDYSALPVDEQSQECDPMVIDAWKRLNQLHREFFERFNSADSQEKKAMQNEFMALFFQYEPFKGDELPKMDESDTLAERATKNIIRVGKMFEAAILQNPGNASNYVSYAVFLKPRNDPWPQQSNIREPHFPLRYFSLRYLSPLPRSYTFLK